MFVVVLLNCDHHQCNDHQLKKICLKVDKNWHRGDKGIVIQSLQTQLVLLFVERRGRSQKERI